jgi:hypothetical protein
MMKLVAALLLPGPQFAADNLGFDGGGPTGASQTKRTQLAVSIELKTPKRTQRF